MNKTVLLAFAVLACAGSTLQALTVTFTEDFDEGVANWRTNSTTTFMTHVPLGGPDGGSYASSTHSNFTYNPNSMTGNTLVLHRGTYNANPTLSASGHNFVGNWITEGVKEFRFTVRHNAPMPLSYFTRFADPVGSPGASAVQLGTVQPNTWTEVAFAITPDNPEFISFQNLTFEQIFDAIGTLQIGVSVPESLAGTGQQYTFDIDKISIAVPEPNTMVISLLGLVGLAIRKRG